jgi:hypothetical protein
LVTEGDGGDYIFVIARENYADGDLAVIRTVGRVESASAVVEADFAADFGAESFG